MINKAKTEIQAILLLFLISGCALTVGTTSTGAAKISEYTYHYVRPGENLFRISKYYFDAELFKDINAGVEKIKTANGLLRDQLSAGQKLLITDTGKKQPSYSLLPPATLLPAAAAETKQETLLEQPKAEEFRPIIADKVFIWPVTGRIACWFGELDNQGIDILVNPGTEVLASDAGKVAFAGMTSKYQETVIIEHSASVYTVYGHDLEITVKKGDEVNRGDVIGKIKSGTHRIRYLHFEIRVDNVAVNPISYLPTQQRQ